MADNQSRGLLPHTPFLTLGSLIPFRSASVGVVTKASQLTVAVTVLVVLGPNSNPANGDGLAGSFSGVLVAAGAGAPNWNVLEAGVLPKLNVGGGAALPNEKVVAAGVAGLFPKLNVVAPVAGNPKEKEGAGAVSPPPPGAAAPLGALGLGAWQAIHNRAAWSFFSPHTCKRPNLVNNQSELVI